MVDNSNTEAATFHFRVPPWETSVIPIVCCRVLSVSPVYLLWISKNIHLPLLFRINIYNSEIVTYNQFKRKRKDTRRKFELINRETQFYNENAKKTKQKKKKNDERWLTLIAERNFVHIKYHNNSRSSMPSLYVFNGWRIQTWSGWYQSNSQIHI